MMQTPLERVKDVVDHFSRHGIADGTSRASVAILDLRALIAAAEAAIKCGEQIVAEYQTQLAVMEKCGVTTFKPEDAYTADEVLLLKALSALTKPDGE